MATDLNDALSSATSTSTVDFPPPLEGPVQDVKNMALVVVVLMCLLTYVPHRKYSKRQRLMPTI